MLFHAW